MSVDGLGQALSRIRQQAAGGFRAATEPLRAIARNAFVDTTAADLGTSPPGGRRGGFGGFGQPSTFNFPPIFGGVRNYGRNVVGAVRGVGEATEHAGSKLFGAAAAGFGLIEPIHAAAELDNTITHIGITLGKNGNDLSRFTASFTRQIAGLARSTFQTSEGLAGAAAFFSQEGYKLPDINAILSTVGRISTAYTADPLAVARTTFALQENMGITPATLPTALAQVALVGKSAALPLEQLAPLFPQVAAQAGMLGVKGLSGVRDLGAMLAVIRKNVGTEGEATTDARAFMQAITSPHTAKRFAQFGVDLLGDHGIIKNAQRKGEDPLEAVLGQVDRITKRGSDLKALGTLFNNQEDRGFVQALLGHLDQYFEIKAKLDKASPAMLGQDFISGSTSLLARLRAFNEALGQLERRFGEGFAPVMDVATVALQRLNVGIEWLDVHAPGLSNGIIGAVGAMLAFATVLGVTGAAAPLVVAGWRLMAVTLAPLAPALRIARLALLPFGAALRVVQLALLPFGAAIRVLISPFRLLAGVLLTAVAPALARARSAVLALEVAMGSSVAGIVVLAALLVGSLVAAAIDIYRHWDRFRGFFVEMGHGIMEVLRGLGDFFVGVFTLDSSRAVGGLTKAWGGLKGFFSGLWSVIKQLFTDLGSWIDGWSGGFATRMLAGIKGSWHFLVDGLSELLSTLRHPMTSFSDGSQIAGAPQLAAVGAAHLAGRSSIAPSAPPAQRVDLAIKLDATPNARLVSATTPTRGVNVMPPSARGPMTDRP